MRLDDLLAHPAHRVLKRVHTSAQNVQDAIRLADAGELREEVVVVRRHLRLDRTIERVDPSIESRGRGLHGALGEDIGRVRDAVEIVAQERRQERVGLWWMGGGGV